MPLKRLKQWNGLAGINAIVDYVNSLGRGAVGSVLTALTGDVTASGPGSSTATIADAAVTYAKMQDVSAASRLLGRGSAAGAGDVQEISLGSGLSMSGTTLSAAGAAAARTITLGLDNAGSAITTGVKADVYLPYAGTITAVTMLADQSGSIVVDIWKDTYANYPPTGADAITASAKPTISSATKSQDTTLTGWTTSVSAGDTLRFNVDSCTAITRLNLVLTVTV